MVTVEQGGDQFQGSSNTTQTRNPQQAPANLQPNASTQTNMQNVVNSSSLFSNPQSGAIITISGSTGQTAESLVAADADTTKNSSSQPTYIFIAALLIVVVGSFLIMRRFAKY